MTSPFARRYFGLRRVLPFGSSSQPADSFSNTVAQLTPALIASLSSPGLIALSSRLESSGDREAGGGQGRSSAGRPRAKRGTLVARAAQAISRASPVPSLVHRLLRVRLPGANGKRPLKENRD